MEYCFVRATIGISKIIGIEVAHIYDQTLRLVKGAPMMDDLPDTLQIRDNHVSRRSNPLMRKNVRTQQHIVKQPSPYRYGTSGLFGWGYGIAFSYK